MKELETNKQLSILEVEDVKLLESKGIHGYKAGMVIDKTLIEKLQQQKQQKQQQKTQQTN